MNVLSRLFAVLLVSLLILCPGWPSSLHTQSDAPTVPTLSELRSTPAQASGYLLPFANLGRSKAVELTTKDHATPQLSIGKISASGSRCSFTLVGPRAPDGYYYGATSAHCFNRWASDCTITVGPLKNHPAKCVYADQVSDLAIVQFKSELDLPYVLIDKDPPKKGSAVWHKGYGSDRPGNIERGKVVDTGDFFEACEHTVSLSPGDSGSGLFLAETVRLMGVNHSTMNRKSWSTSYSQLLIGFSRVYPPISIDYLPYVGYSSYAGPKPPTTEQE